MLAERPAALKPSVAAAPSPKEMNTAAAQRFAHHAARLCADAGRHFNRGQYAFFFALGWFFGPLPLALTTTGIVILFGSGSSHPMRARPSRKSQPRRGVRANRSGHSHQDGDSRHDHHAERGRKDSDQLLVPTDLSRDFLEADRLLLRRA